MLWTWCMVELFLNRLSLFYSVLNQLMSYGCGIDKKFNQYEGIKIDVYDLFIMWYLYEKSLVFSRSKVPGQKCPFKSGQLKVTDEYDRCYIHWKPTKVIRSGEIQRSSRRFSRHIISSTLSSKKRTSRFAKSTLFEIDYFSDL